LGAWGGRVGTGNGRGSFWGKKGGAGGRTRKVGEKNGERGKHRDMAGQSTCVGKNQGKGRPLHLPSCDRGCRGRTWLGRKVGKGVVGGNLTQREL